MTTTGMHSCLALPSLDTWRAFWAENDYCLYGHAMGGDARPVRPAFTTERPHVPVLVELGEDWVIHFTRTPYRRYLQDFGLQQRARAAAAERLRNEIGFHLKPRIDSASLLHGSIYGNPIEYPEDSTPWLGHLIHSADDIRPLIRRMETVDVAQAGLVPWFVARYRDLGQPYRWRILHDPTAVHGPGTILSFLCGINDLGLYLYDAPELICELLSLVGEITVAYSRTIRRLTNSPPTGVAVFDDVAGLVSRRQFERFFLPVYQRIYSELAPLPDDDRFYHNDARVCHLLDMLAGLQINGINPDPQTDPALIRRRLPKAIIYGCVPPLILQNGTPDEVADAARRSISLAGEGGGLVLTTAGSINLGTPYANLWALCVTAQQSGDYSKWQ